MEVEIQCANPNDMRLAVKVEMTIGEWRALLSRLGDARFYGPLHELLTQINSGIAAIERREPVKGLSAPSA
jgi:hypothetical protein